MYEVTDLPVPIGWTHMVLNYDIYTGKGFDIYYNGTFIGGDNAPYTGSFSVGDGHTVIGRRRLVTFDTDYASVQMDELVFFNKKLTDDQIYELIVIQHSNMSLR